MDPRAVMFSNRLRKNLRRLLPWAKQRKLDAFRLYDHDIPEVKLVVDRYGSRIVVWEKASRHREQTGTPQVTGAAPDSTPDEERAALQEFTEETPSADFDGERGHAFIDDVLAVVLEHCAEPFGVRSEDIFLKIRQRQRGRAQYQRLESAQQEFVIQEGGHRFLVNLSDYLDTGLFLDHRETRALTQKLCRGKRVLNLFAYTGSFSVYAAAGGATSTVTMDLSNTYLDWAGRNFALNGMDPRRHRRVRAEVLSYLHDPRCLPEFLGPFDFIVLDPPTFSNSKKMHGTLDVLRDHGQLIEQSLRLLAPGGLLLFSCNHHRFELRDKEAPSAHFYEISAQTLPKDFHDPRTHRCFIVTRRADAVDLRSVEVGLSR